MAKKMTSLGKTSFHDFKKEPIFEGIYTGNKTFHKEDNKKYSVKKGDIEAYEFRTLEGKPVLVSAKTVISSVMEDTANQDKVKEGAHIYIESKGEKTSSSGMKYHDFDLAIIEEEEETEEEENEDVELGESETESDK